MTGNIVIAICVAFVLLITFACFAVSSRWSRQEEKEDGETIYCPNCGAKMDGGNEDET